MRSGGLTKTDAGDTTLAKKGRKSLHPLQPAATDKENLVGAGRHLRSSTTGKRDIKNEMSDKGKGDVQEALDAVAVVKGNIDKKATLETKVSSKQLHKDEKKGRIFKDKGIQTESSNKIKITNEDLTSTANPSENYWKILAERRRVALEEALADNEMLSNQISVYKEMLDESSALVEVLKEMLGDDRNDIDNSLEDSRQ